MPNTPVEPIVIAQPQPIAVVQPVPAPVVSVPVAPVEVAQVAVAVPPASPPMTSGISATPQPSVQAMPPQPIAPPVAPFVQPPVATSPSATLVSPQAQMNPQPPVQPPPAALKTPLKKKKNPFGFLAPLFAVLVILGVAGGSFYLYWSSQQKLTDLSKATPQAYEEYQTQSLVARVSKHMDLPSETPLINTITNAASMRQEPFYSKAEDGDKVLVFSKRPYSMIPCRTKLLKLVLSVQLLRHQLLRRRVQGSRRWPVPLRKLLLRPPQSPH